MSVFRLPTVIDRGGIQKVIKLKLADEERIGLDKFSERVKKHDQKTGFGIILQNKL